MTREDMRDRKRELGLTNEMIAERSGVPYPTVQKFFSGTTKAPRQKTIDAIQRVLCPAQPENDSLGYRYLPEDAFRTMVREAEAAYSAVPKTRHSVEDYYALPDDIRAELIDGQYYQMYAPTYVHQTIILEMAAQVRDCMKEHSMPCRVFCSPIDVQLDCDRWTMVEPDLIILCDRSKIKGHICFGAPDFIVEVLSPSTSRKDLYLKLHKYEHAGVREYWMIDPEKRQVLVYRFEEDAFPSIYGFDDRIRIGISRGLCEIDFSAVTQEIAWVEELEDGAAPEA